MQNIALHCVFDASAIDLLTLASRFSVLSQEGTALTTATTSSSDKTSSSDQISRFRFEGAPWVQARSSSVRCTDELTHGLVIPTQGASTQAQLTYAALGCSIALDVAVSG